jgi:hypothetical protein
MLNACKAGGGAAVIFSSAAPSDSNAGLEGEHAAHAATTMTTGMIRT